VPQVERLRGKLDEALQPSKENFPLQWKPPCKPLLSRVVDIPSTTGPESRPPAKKNSVGGGVGGPEGGDTVTGAASPTDGLPDRENCFMSSAGNTTISPRTCPLGEEAAKDDGGRELSHHRLKQQQQQQQQQQQRQSNRSTASSSSGRNGGTGGGQGRRRVRMRQGEALISSRARAGLLGVLGPGGSRGYLTIDGPVATGSSTSARVRGGGNGNEGAGGRAAGGGTHGSAYFLPFERKCLEYWRKGVASLSLLPVLSCPVLSCPVPASTFLSRYVENRKAVSPRVA